MKTLQQQLEAFRKELADKKDARTVVFQKSLDEDRTLDAEEEKLYDELGEDVEKIEKHIGRLETAIEADQKTATKTDDKGRGPAFINTNKSDPEDQFEGQSFARLTMIKTLAQLEHASEYEIAKQAYGHSHPQFVENIGKAYENRFKASVPAAGTQNPNFLGNFTGPNYAGDFIDYLDKNTAYAELKPGFREVPPNMPIPGQGSNATGYWVDEGHAIPVTNFDTNTRTLGTKKCGSIVVLSKELIREFTIDGERYVRDSLAEGMRQLLDSKFFSDDAETNAAPAGILNGVTAIAYGAGSGSPLLFGGTASTGAEIRALVVLLKQAFINANNHRSGALKVCLNPLDVLGLGEIKSSTGDSYEFPEIASGNFRGVPIVESQHVNQGDVIYIKPDDIYSVQDQGLTTEVSTDATLELADNPTGQAVAGAGSPSTVVDQSSPRVSLFQSDAIAIKCVRPMNFVKRRSGSGGAVAWADGQLDV